MRGGSIISRNFRTSYLNADPSDTLFLNEKEQISKKKGATAIERDEKLFLIFLTRGVREGVLRSANLGQLNKQRHFNSKAIVSQL